VDQSGADRVVGELVDEYEAAGLAVVVVGIERNGPVGTEVADADLVELELLGRHVLHRVHVNAIAEIGDTGVEHPWPDLHQVGSARQHVLLVHPDHGHLELVGYPRGRGSGGKHVAPAHVDLVLEGQGDGLTIHGLLQVAVLGHDSRDLALPTRRQDANQVTWTHDPSGDGTGEPAEILVRPVDPLHRQPERPLLQALFDFDRLEVLHHGRPVVPGHPVAGLGDVVAFQGRHRDGGDVLETQAPGKLAVLGDDGLEHLVPVSDRVHLVHGKHHVPDAKQRDDVAMPASL
jgi:hypothetical protein